MQYDLKIKTQTTMKLKILFLALLLTTITLNAQNKSHKHFNTKKIYCYVESEDENGKIQGVWMKYRTSKFFTAMEKDELISYQKKMKSKGLDVNTIGYIDQKTVEAHKEYKKILKKEKRQKRIEKQKAKHKMP